MGLHCNMESDNLILEIWESSEDEGKEVIISSGFTYKEFTKHSDSEQQLGSDSTFPILLIDSVCSLQSDVQNRNTIVNSNNRDKKESDDEPKALGGSLQSSPIDVLPFHSEDDNLVICDIKAYRNLESSQHRAQCSMTKTNSRPTPGTSRNISAMENDSPGRHAFPTFSEKLSFKYDIYRKRNNEASRLWRRKHREKIAEAVETNKRLQTQHQNLTSLVEKLRSNNSTSDFNSDETSLDMGGEEDPLADEGPPSKKTRMQQSHVKLEKDNERLTRENNRLCQVIEQLMKRKKC